MARRVTPMIHVPDVRATVTWYESVGFNLESTNASDGELDWAALSFGEGQVMFNAGGKPSKDERREVDLYVNVEGVDALYARLKPLVELKQELHDAFHGMREFTVRDPNGFWLTFGERLRSP